MKYLLYIFLTFPFVLFSQTEKAKIKKDFIIHNIVDDDTYHSLKLKYGISKRKIIKWNPELKKCKFLSDCSEILKIKILINEKNQSIINSLQDSILIEQSVDSNEFFFDTPDTLDFISSPTIDSLIFQKKDTIINIAVLLPFFSNTTDSVISTTPSKKLNHKRFLTKSRISLDFYSGLLFSFEEFFNGSNLKLNLNVFDTYHSIDTIKKILTDIDLNSMDLIIGPLYQNNFDFLVKSIDNPNVTIISPLQSSSIKKTYLSNNDVYFFESELDKKIAYTSNYIFNKYLKDIHSSNTISIFLKEEDEGIKKIISNFLKDWNDRVIYYEIEESTISEQMKEKEINSISDIVFIPSNDPVFVSDLISRLHALKDTNMIVFCNEDILNFELIPHSELYDLNVHFFSEKNPGFDNKKFIKSFFEYFSTNPQSKFVQSGYKCGTYFLNLFFKNFIFSNEYNVLGTYYKFILQPNNIYRNEALKLWKYEKYSINEVSEFNENQ